WRLRYGFGGGLCCGFGRGFGRGRFFANRLFCLGRFVRLFFAVFIFAGEGFFMEPCDPTAGFLRERKGFHALDAFHFAASKIQNSERVLGLFVFLFLFFFGGALLVERGFEEK